MTAPPQPLHRPRLAPRLLSLALLVLQAVGATGVELAHAADPAAGPVSIEARHTDQCAVLHDASRCALCHFAQLRAVTMPALMIPPARTPELTAFSAVPASVTAGESRPAAPSRGPPTLLS